MEGVSETGEERESRPLTWQMCPSWGVHFKVRDGRFSSRRRDRQSSSFWDLRLASCLCSELKRREARGCMMKSSASSE